MHSGKRIHASTCPPRTLQEMLPTLVCVGLTRIGGLSARPLLVRCVVVLVPLSAILVLCTVLWPNARIRLEILPALTTEVTVVLVPITTDASERLEHNSPLLRLSNR